jgi:hypothetical protein
MNKLNHSLLLPQYTIPKKIHNRCDRVPTRRVEGHQQAADEVAEVPQQTITGTDTSTNITKRMLATNHLNLLKSGISIEAEARRGIG